MKTASHVVVYRTVFRDRIDDTRYFDLGGPPAFARPAGCSVVYWRAAFFVAVFYRWLLTAGGVLQR